MNNNYIFRAVIVTLLVAFFFGAYLLENIGVKYVSEGGNPVFKIHLYSYLVLSLVSIVFLNGKLSTYINGLGKYQTSWVVSLTCIVFVILYGLFRQGMSGMAYIIDMSLTPLLIIPLILMLDERQKKVIIKIMAYLILINASIAIVEFALNRSFFVEQSTNFSHFRSAAFLTHPLNNALVTATLAPLLMNKTNVPSILYLFIVFIALFAFGGRGSTAIFILGMLILSIPTIKRFVTSGVEVTLLRFSLYQLGFFIVFISLISAMLYTSIGDRILSKLFIDTSAQARFDVFFLLDAMSIKELIFGASNELKDSVIFIMGQKTIENYIIGWIMSFGLVGTIALLISVFLIPIKMAWNMNLNAKISIAILSFASITNNALSTKTIILLFLFTVIACLLEKGEKNVVV